MAYGKVKVDSIETSVHTLTLPTSSGSNGQGLVTNGSGTLSWAEPSDPAGSFRTIPQNSKTTSYTLVASDTGKHISITTGGVTIPASVFSAGAVISIYNNSGSSQTITQGSGTTVRQAGTTNTGNRTLSEYGLATVLCVANDTFVISGAGLV